MAFPIATIIAPLATFFTDWLKVRSAKTAAKIKLNQAVTDAKIEAMKTQQQADIAWENTSLETAGIKDEIMMFIILAPMVACFFPGGAELVKTGFKAMAESLPTYWEIAFLTVLGASFGVRKFVDFMSWKKGA